MTSYREPAARLRLVAADQSGYFTARQAKQAGYSYRAQHYQASVGEWERVARGVYRLSGFPTQMREDLVVLTLLSTNRAGEPQAVVSHDSALAIHELSDINPAQVHLTIPPGFRKHMPERVVLHVARLEPEDWEERDGYRVTVPVRTIIDAAAGPLSQEILDAAVRDALARGLAREKTLLVSAPSPHVGERLRTAINAYQNGMHS